MSYRHLGTLPAISPTTMFAQAVDPYAHSQVPPGSIYAPYGWGPDFMYGMPMNYSHHIGYVRSPVPGTRRIGPMYDTVNPYLGGCGCSGGLGGRYDATYRRVPETWRDDVRYVRVTGAGMRGFGSSGDGLGLAGILAVL